MMRLGWLALLAAALQAQTGNYYFVELSVRGAGANAEVRNAGGTMALSVASAGLQIAGYTGVIGLGDQPGQDAAFTEGTLKDGVLTTPLGGPLNLRQNDGGAVLIASSVAGDNFDLFVAVKAGDSVAPLRGPYHAAYFGLANGSVSGLTTAFLDFAGNGVGGWQNVVMNGHTSARDDVNREERPAVAFSMDAGGRGVARFPAGSDLIAGDREMMVSSDGRWLIGYGRGAGQRDIFIGLQSASDRSAAAFDSLYWINELTAETPFAFDANAVRFSSAEGTVIGDGVSRATIAERIARQRATGVATTWLTTANAFYADSTGRAAFVPAITADRRKNNLHFTFDGLIGAHVGVPGELTLEHGLWVGARVSGREATPALGPRISANGIVNAASFSPGPAAPLGYLSLFGLGLAGSSAVASGTSLPLELAGTRVLVNGQPAPLHWVSPGQVNVQMPEVQGPTATLQVSTAAGASNVVTVPVAASSPGVFPGAVLHSDFSAVSPAAPARPGETLIAYATGLGAVSPPVTAGAAAGASPLSRTTDASLRVTIGGVPAIVEFSGLAPGFAGLYQLNVRVPDEAPDAPAAAFTISLADSYIDITEIRIAR